MNTSINSDKEAIKKEEPIIDKDKFITEFKDTVKDLPFLIKKLFQPLISLIEKKFDTLPPEQRKNLQRIHADIKKASQEGISSLKNIISKITTIIIPPKNIKTPPPETIK